jgi:hypothetical protein
MAKWQSKLWASIPWNMAGEGPIPWNMVGEGLCENPLALEARRNSAS